MKPLTWPSPNSVGSWQIIPNVGAHEQIYVSQIEMWMLHQLGLVVYDEEYGPYARVFRPVEPADADTVREWL